jgi:hypothetical protein
MPGEHSGPAGGGQGGKADRPVHNPPPKKKPKPDYGGLDQVPHANDPFNNGGHSQPGGSTQAQLNAQNSRGGGAGGGNQHHASSAGGGAGGGNGNVATIVAFLRGKGFSDAQIAGALGNMKVESNFDPTNPNPNEGAIGLCQWEGGRRAALQQFAAAHGGSETDLQIQLEFMWHEWHTTENYAFQQIMGQSTVAGAATAWDKYYERSDGTTRQDRVYYAQTAASRSRPGTKPGLVALHVRTARLRD